MTIMTKDQAPTFDALGTGEKEYSTNLTRISHDMPPLYWFKSSDEGDFTLIW
jgi:hypothetical protein